MVGVRSGGESSTYHRALAAQVARGGHRVVSVWGPGGYEKWAFLRAYAASAGSPIVCDLAASHAEGDLAGVVLAALAGRDRSRAVRSAADRLARRHDPAARTSREALRGEWQRADAPELLVLRDATGALSTPAGVDLVGELLATRPEQRTVALCTRAPLPRALEQLAERERAHALGPERLALPIDVLRSLADEGGLTPSDADAIHALTGGWPLASRSFVLLLQREGRAVLDDAAGLPREALLAYAVQRTIWSIDERLREALAALAVRPGATPAELVRVLGERCDDAVVFRLGNLPFVLRDGERAYVHPDVVALLRARFGPLIKTHYERTLHALAEDGAHGVAAAVALEGGDAERAAELLDGAPPYTAARVALAEYERVLNRIGREAVVRYPNVWLATIPFRRFAVDLATYIREAETVAYCLPHSTPPDKRAVALMHLASAYFNIGRVAECDRVIDSGLRSFAAAEVPARASLLNFAASIRGEEGRFAQARALADEAAAISRDGFGENLTLHHIDAYEAIVRGWYDRVVVIFDELVRRHAHDELPLYLAYSATDGAFWAWAYGDDATSQRYLTVLEDALTPGLERGFARMIDAARGRPIAAEDSYAWPVHSAMAHLYRLGFATGYEERLDAARAAARAADERRDPGLQIFAHAALAVLDEAARPAELELLRAIAARVESPELREAIAQLAAGTGAGMLEPFVRRRVLPPVQERSPSLVVELLAGRVSRGGTTVRLSDKEFELVALLASSRGPVSRDRIGEALWDHLDPEEWPNNVKVTLSRLRAKLGLRDAVLASGGSYRLAPAIEVDLRRYDSLVRACGSGPLDERTQAALRGVLQAYRTGGAARYDRFAWMQTTLARMHELVLAAGLALAGDALRGERYDDALRYAGEVSDVDPYDEAACEIVVRACFARGDRDAGRREFRRYAAALASGLGAVPSAALTALVEPARAGAS